MKSEKVKMIAMGAFFIALDIIVARFLGFEVPTPLGPIKVDFQVVVAALAGYFLGPIWAAITLVSSDLLGVLLNSGSMGAFFGFTLSAGLRGFIFGMLLYKKNPTVKRIIFSVPCVFIPVDLFLNTLWLTILMGGTPYFPFLVARIIPKLLLMVAECLILVCLRKLFVVLRPVKPSV